MLTQHQPEQGHDDTALCLHSTMLTQHHADTGPWQHSNMPTYCHVDTAPADTGPWWHSSMPTKCHDDTAPADIGPWHSDADTVPCWHSTMPTQGHPETGPCWHSSTPLNMWLSSAIRNSALTLLLIILWERYWFVSITLPNIWTSPHFRKIHCLSSCCEAVLHSVHETCKFS